MKPEKIISDIKKEIVPTKKEESEKKKKIDLFIKKLNQSLPPKTKAILGGSAKKNTWLRESYDADIFVKFEYDSYVKKNSKLSDILDKSIKKKFKKISRVHGSRDYFQINEKDFIFEIIPILDISNSKDAVNITDISPLHAEWVLKNVKDFDEVRVAKAFFKAQNIYGAESYIKGFSGYSIEILIAHYKTFLNLLKAVIKWRERRIIDIKKYHKNIEIEVNKSKLVSPLVLIDPVQKGRNVAAALSKENYARLKNISKEFLKNPSKIYFITRQIDLSEINNNNNILIDVKPLKGKEDVVGAKLLKAYEFFTKKINEYGFEIQNNGWHWDRKDFCVIWLNTKQKKLSKEKVWKGPPLDKKDHAKIFKKKYPGSYVKNGFLYAKVRRKYTEPVEFAKSISRNSYLQDKAKKIEIKK